MHSRRAARRSSLLLAILALAAAGCGGEGEGGEAPASVRSNIASFKFLPRTIELRAGGSITWINRDKAPHTATSDDGAEAKFDTRRLKTGESRRVRFDEPGSYPYFCVFHPFMQGTVAVRR